MYGTYTAPCLGKMIHFGRPNTLKEVLKRKDSQMFEKSDLDYLDVLEWEEEVYETGGA